MFTAAKERIRHVYETYDQVVVSYSGGKDSTCVLELNIDVARELHRSMDGGLSLADREGLLRMCDLAHKLGRRAMGIGQTSE